MSLPLLDTRFWREQKPNLEFFQKWKTFATWSDQILPVYEWDAMLFVAVSSPDFIPAALTESKNVVIVMAGPSEISALWQEWQLPATPATLTTEAAADFETIAVQKPQGANLTPAPESSLVLQDDPVVEAPIASRPESVDDGGMPEGLQFGSTPPAVASATPAQAEGSLELLDLSLLSTEKPAVANVAEISAAGSGPKVMPTDWVSDLFSQLNAHFSKSMIILIQGYEAKAWRWNEGFQPKSEDLPTWDLQKRGPFSLVAKTGKPFHGPLVANEEVQKFSEFWNQNKPLRSLTLVPLIENQKVFGLLLTEIDQEGIDLDKLAFAEKIGTQIMTTLRKQPELLLAA